MQSLRTTALVAAFLLLASGAQASKHPERKIRDNYARTFAAEVEHDGWEVNTWAMSPGCPELCIFHGNHDTLRIEFDGATVEAVDRFASQELAPRLPELRKLGFVEIDLLGLYPSHTYPDGTARFPIAVAQKNND